MFVTKLKVTFSIARKHNQSKTENINDFGLIGPEDFLEGTIREIRNDLIRNLLIAFVVSTIIIGTLLAVLIMMYLPRF